MKFENSGLPQTPVVKKAFDRFAKLNPQIDCFQPQIVLNIARTLAKHTGSEDYVCAVLLEEEAGDRALSKVFGEKCITAVQDIAAYYKSNPVAEGRSFESFIQSQPESVKLFLLAALLSAMQPTHPEAHVLLPARLRDQASDDAKLLQNLRGTHAAMENEIDRLLTGVSP